MVSDDDDPFPSLSTMSIGSPSLPSGFDESDLILLHKNPLRAMMFDIQPKRVSDVIALLLILSLEVFHPFLPPPQPPPPPPH